MKKIILGLSLLFCSSILFTQKAVITGIVKEKSTGEPLLADVTYAPGKGGKTDFDGLYRLELDPGTYTITVSSFPLVTQKFEVTLTAGESITKNLFLTDNEELDPVTITASRFGQNESEVPISIVTIGVEDLEEQATVQIDDMLNKTSAVNIQDGQASIRGGNGFSYGAGSRVLLMVDGMPLLAADAGDARWNFLPIENVSQIEVVKGAASVLYGSSALNGIVHVRTAYPTDKPLTKISLFAGFYDDPYQGVDRQWTSDQKGYQGLRFLHSRQINNVDLVVGGNFYNTGDYRPGVQATRGRVNFNTRIRSKKVKGLNYGLNGNFQVSDQVNFFLWKSADSALYKGTGSGAGPSSNYRTAVDPFVEYYSPKGNKHSVKTRWFRTGNNPNDPSQKATSDLLYGEYQFQRELDTNTVLTSGFATVYSIVNSNLYGDNHSKNFAVFGQVDKKIGKWNLTGGVRLEYFQINDEKPEFTFEPFNIDMPIQPVFRFGANYEPKEFTNFRASYGQGYRFPSIAEKFISVNVGGVKVIPSPNLTPETGFNGEIGVRQGFKVGKKWKGFVDIAGFWTQYENMMEFTFGFFDSLGNPVVPTSIQDIQNSFGAQAQNVDASAVRITGIDANILGKGEISRNFSVSFMLGYTFMNPKAINPSDLYLSTFSSVAHASNFADFINPFEGIDSLAGESDTVSNVLKYRFNHMIKADIQLDIYSFSVGANLRYTSRVQNIDYLFEHGFYGNLILPGLREWRRTTNPNGNFVVDTRVSYKFPQTTLSFVVNNLMNKEYASRPGLLQAPRTFVLQWAWKF